MEIAQYIFSILKSQIWILFSWGFEHPIALNESDEAEGGLRFNVHGFKHTGIVDILLAWDDTFTIQIINQDGSVKETINDVYIDNLISVVDEAVEKVEDYKERVNAEYRLK